MAVLTKTRTLQKIIQHESVKSTLKPYFRDEEAFKLYLGNSLDIIGEFKESYFDMIFADPPYMLSNGGFTVHAGKMVSVHKGDWDKSKGVEEDFVFHQKWIEACRRVLKPNGTIWISGTYHSIYSCGYALMLAGFKILNDITWFKPNASPNLSGRYFTASHETLLWARKDPNGKHKFNYSKMKNGNWPEDQLKNPEKQMRSVWSIDDTMKEESVWAIGTPKAEEKKFGKHPTQKPLTLLKRIVIASTDQDDRILDPFTGSSTTGIAAVVLKRHFIGIDMDRG